MIYSKSYRINGAESHANGGKMCLKNKHTFADWIHSNNNQIRYDYIDVPSSMMVGGDVRREIIIHAAKNMHLAAHIR